MNSAPAATPDVSHYDGQDLEALADLPNYTGWILDAFGERLRGRVIEVGAGLGNVSARYLDRVESALLVEPALNLHARLAARFAADRRVTTACAVLGDLADQPPFDAALMVNVLEHIDDDVAVLAGLRARIRPGGAVLIFVPALPALYGSLDRLVHHVRRYTRAELADKFGLAGLRPVEVRYLDVLGMVPWFVAGRVLRQRRFDARGAAWFDCLAVPIGRAIEGRLRVPVGKSLVGIALREA